MRCHAHAWVVLVFALCAAFGDPPLAEIWMPTEAACQALALELRSERVFGWERPGQRVECRSAEETREAGPCEPAWQWGM